MTDQTTRTARARSAAIVWCPFPDRETARGAAEVLLSEKLIACANVIPTIESIFEYDGKISTACEIAAVFKTTAETLEKVISRLGQLHPYDTPAIVGWVCNSTHPATLNWLDDAIGAV